MEKKEFSSSFFQNIECEYFPCHEAIEKSNFNCLFCYCPLYALGNSCNGNYTYTEKGVKDCSNCIVPHDKNNYELILQRIKESEEKTFPTN